MKKLLAMVLTAMLVISLASCGGAASSAAAPESSAEESSAAESSKEESSTASSESAAESSEESSAESTEESPAESSEESAPESGEEPAAEAVTVRVGSLKGPTTIGIVKMIAENEGGDAYTFTVATQADGVLPKMVSGDLDIALVPANAAASLYNKTKGGVTVIDINTLGVLYCVTGDESITSVKDLAGKTVLSTGQGTTPEYALRYLLTKYGIEDTSIEFLSEPTEVAARLAEDPSQIAVLPQPFVTVAMMQNEALKIAFSLTDEWDAVPDSDGSRMLTGVTIVRTAFLAEHKDLVDEFLAAHTASAAACATDLDTVADLVVAQEIVPKAPVAKKAIPQCNIVCVTGEEMKTALSGYLAVLFEMAPESVGGALPGDDFYYMP